MITQGSVSSEGCLGELREQNSSIKDKILHPTYSLQPPGQGFSRPGVPTEVMFQQLFQEERMKIASRRQHLSEHSRTATVAITLSSQSHGLQNSNSRHTGQLPHPPRISTENRFSRPAGRFFCFCLKFLCYMYLSVSTWSQEANLRDWSLLPAYELLGWNSGLAASIFSHSHTLIYSAYFFF